MFIFFIFSLNFKNNISVYGSKQRRNELKDQIKQLNILESIPEVEDQILDLHNTAYNDVKFCYKDCFILFDLDYIKSITIDNDNNNFSKSNYDPNFSTKIDTNKQNSLITRSCDIIYFCTQCNTPSIFLPEFMGEKDIINRSSQIIIQSLFKIFININEFKENYQVDKNNENKNEHLLDVETDIDYKQYVSGIVIQYNLKSALLTEGILTEKEVEFMGKLDVKVKTKHFDLNIYFTMQVDREFILHFSSALVNRKNFQYLNFTTMHKKNKINSSKKDRFCHSNNINSSKPIFNIYFKNRSKKKIIEVQYYI